MKIKTSFHLSLQLALLLCCTTSFAQTKRIKVAQDGSGNFKTVQAAFDAVPLNNKKPIVIFISKGRYYEKLHLDSSKNCVTVIGEDKFETILTYNDHSGKVSPKGDTINTYTSESFLIRASDFTAQNISFENNAGFNAGQAVAVHVYGDKTRFLNCRFLGFQDVLFTSNARSRQYYENCYIEGTTDFIFGASTAWFQHCHIHSKKNSHVTAASTPQDNAYGYVFNDCVLTADSTLRGVSLGRPWRPYASVTYMNCYIDRHIIPEGWNNWKNPANEKTARFAEYKSYGPGANPQRRLGWARQLNEEEARRITLKNVFPGWNPLK
jgi:pectinesterase